MIVLRQQQFLLGFDSFDLAEVPRLGLDGLQLGHVIGGYVPFLLGGFAPGQPPVALRVVQYLQVFALPEAEVFVRARVVIVQGDEYLGGRDRPVGQLLFGRGRHRHRSGVVRQRRVLHGQPGHGGRRGLLDVADAGRRAHLLLVTGRASSLTTEAAAHV